MNLYGDPDYFKDISFKLFCKKQALTPFQDEKGGSRISHGYGLYFYEKQGRYLEFTRGKKRTGPEKYWKDFDPYSMLLLLANWF